MIYTLKTNVDEVIDYNNIVVESSEEVTIPEKIETQKVSYTLGSVKQQIIDVNNQIDVLNLKKIELQALKDAITLEADKVLTAVK
jgi:hypothetical protein